MATIILLTLRNLDRGDDAGKQAVRFFDIQHMQLEPVPVCHEEGGGGIRFR